MNILQKNILSEVKQYCLTLEQEFHLIPDERKDFLTQLSLYISKKIEEKLIPSIVVICTHNSRRSHLGQIWLSIGADFYELPPILTFSGGTESTALNQRVVTALCKIGLKIQSSKKISPDNPIYEIDWGQKDAPYLAFSKRYREAPNPTDAFAAIMVCSEADEGCPIVKGADFRLSLPYDDPKTFDDTAQESSKYDERCQQIGREMLFVLSKVKTALF